MNPSPSSSLGAAVLAVALLSGGGGASAQAYDAEHCTPFTSQGGLPTAWSGRRRAVHAAVCEWAKFGFPTVVVREVPDDRTNRLPGELALSETLSEAVRPAAVAAPATRRAVEVQVRFGRSESDLSVYDRVSAYWMATSPGYARAAQAARRERPTAPPGWWTAWSAAFTSWVMRQARADWIPSDDNHTAYLRAAAANRPGAVVTIDRFQPQAGDLVCFPRLATEGEADERAAPAAFLSQVRSGRTFPAHCDVVVRRNRSSLVVIGGNVKNAVTATVVPLDSSGRLVRTSVRPWTVGVSLGEPADPCARIEAVSLPGWSEPAVLAARRGALGRVC